MAKQGGFLEEVRNTPGGNAINLCIQCGTCTGSCPNANYMEHSPRKVIAMVRAGLREEVLSSNSMWFCSACYLCTVRCPRDIKPTELMHALECLAISSGLVKKGINTPVFYKTFVDSIKSNGRVHELGMMLKFYWRTFWFNLKTNPVAAIKMISLVGMLPLSLRLLMHGRMPIRAKKIEGKEGLSAIIEKARALVSVR